jgi:SAM-dependent methyltransferase/phage repressor protein C with HTH and peptisase S24 domain
MDFKTVEYYGKNAKAVAEVYDSSKGGISRYFSSSFLPDSRILDIGCGNGRDLNILLSMGYDAKGIDACREFVDLYGSLNSDQRERMSFDKLPELSSVPDRTFDAVLCSAVLMHLPEELLFDASFSIRRVLKENGRLLLSVPLTGPEVDADSKRDEKGRLFNGVAPENFELIFERIGFKLINRWDSDDSLDRKERKWATMLFTLENSSGSRPIDTIESVLNRDKKVATYKLALFRALADIALTSYNSVLWDSKGNVLVPVSTIADKWIEYYWPLFEPEKMIPQIQAEAENGKPVAFRFLLNELIEKYRYSGGLSAFSTDYRNNNLPDNVTDIYKKLISKLKTTIVSGPVTFAGGAGGNPVFDYEKGYVKVPFSIWKELSLTGHWITDAAILRWAELTFKISKESVRPGDVIDLLLTSPVPERDVYCSKSFYDSLKNKECVWTGKSIEQKYDVDHAIPYSLWKNNDLWNLFPADTVINSKKRDRLPANPLIRKRKDCIINYWELVKEKYPARFEYEAEKLAGNGYLNAENWQNKLFSRFSEAIEYTAVQRGIERWEPETITRIVKMTETLPQKSVPFYPDLKVACGGFDGGRSDEGSCEMVTVEDVRDNIDPSNCFVVKACGDSMDGGIAPVKDGDFLLFEFYSGGPVTGNLLAVKYDDGSGDFSYVLKKIGKDAPGRYRLVSLNKDYTDIVVDNDKMLPFARLKGRLERDGTGFILSK